LSRAALRFTSSGSRILFRCRKGRQTPTSLPCAPVGQGSPRCHRSCAAILEFPPQHPGKSLQLLTKTVDKPNTHGALGGMGGMDLRVLYCSIAGWLEYVVGDLKSPKPPNPPSTFQQEHS
jgi:hypothetical protein